jgi:hypothetical protein
MKQRQRYPWLVAVLLALTLLLAACGGNAASDRAEDPTVVEQIAGTDVYRITLSPQAARRLDVQTAAVKERGSETVIPYSALFYSSTGETWAYVNTKPLTFVREAIVVDHIDGDRAILSDGPSAGTKVVTAGVPELHGIEVGAGGIQ